MYSRFARISKMLLIAACALAPGLACSAQALRSATEIPESKIDVYGGYGYFHPLNSGINGYQYQDIYNLNATASVTGYFNRYIGAQIEGAYFNGPSQFLTPPCPGNNCYTHDQKIYTFEGGPVVRLPLGRFVPFVHALGGGVRINGPVYQPLTWGWGVTGGGGLDYVLPFFHDRIAVRPIQADFQYSQVVYGPLVLPAGQRGGFGEIDALKLSGGAVVRFGGVSMSQPAMLGCTTEPVTVFPGDPVTVTGSTMYLNPKRQPVYTWASTGGKVMPSGATATIDTAGLAPGDYTVNGHVSTGSKAKDQASCTAPFTVKSFEPPTISCAASPSTVASGAVVDISTTGTSPQNRPLTYSYATTAGALTSTGPTAKLNTGGLGASTVTVTCNLVDDLGKTATATTTVTVTAPTVPVIAETKSLCSLSFTRDTRRPVRVDNEAKGCLDDIALTLNQQSDAKLVIIGNASPEEKPEAAAQRTLNIRQYLTQEKGVDAGRIDVRVGDTSGRTARTTLVPAGAIFPDAGTQSFDEKAIPRTGQAYGTGQGMTAPVVRKPKRRKHRVSAVPTPADAATPAVGAP